MPCSFRIKSEMLLEIHIVEKWDFLKLILHSQIIRYSIFQVSVISVTSIIEELHRAYQLTVHLELIY